MERGAQPTCPACGAHLPQAGGAPAIGSPFATCPSCQTDVARADRDEWDLMAPGTRLSIVGRRFVRAALIGIVPALLVGLVGILSGRAHLETPTLLALGLGGLFVAGVFTVLRTGEEIRRSQRRMSDPMYRARLVRFGIETERGRTQDGAHRAG